MTKLQRPLKGVIHKNLLKYLPGMKKKNAYQSMIFATKTKTIKKPVDSSYNDL